MTHPSATTPAASHQSPRRAGLLISLPRGLSAGGVTTWAVRTVNELASRGRPCRLIVHREDARTQRLMPTLHHDVGVIDLAHLPPVDSCSGDLAPYIPVYHRAIRELVARTERPAIVAPTLLGDSFGIAAAISLVEPELLRVVGWQHSPIPYDRVVLARYEPIIARFVAVSAPIAASLRSVIPARAGDVRLIHHGVAIPAAAPRDGFNEPRVAPVRGDRDVTRPLRLIYVGRMDDDIKRASSLVTLSRELTRRGIDHRLTLVGDGPAANDIDRAARDPQLDARVRRLEPLPPQHVSSLLAEHDLFLLPSRLEGLSLSVMEAMAAGCVPIITRTPSGASDLVVPGESGELLDVADDAPPDAIARVFADAVQGALARDLGAMSRSARRRAEENFSLAAYATSVSHLLDEAANSPPRPWPADRPCAFTASPASSGSDPAHPSGSGALPAEGPARTRSLLESLRGRSIIVHGTGRHSLELASAWGDSPARIVAFADDDPKRQGSSIWGWPIIAPARAAGTGATDVVVSSWMNQDSIWDRRAIYEDAGLKVHRIYDSQSK